MNAGLMMMRNARHNNNSSNKTKPRGCNGSNGSSGRNVSVDSLKNIWKMVRCEPEWDNYVNIIESIN